MGSMGSLLPGTVDPVPAIVTSEEEICRVIIAVKGSEAIQTGLSQVMELTRDNGVEYSGWILKDGHGQYSLSVIKKGEAMSVIPNPKPVNAIGNFHTHVSSSARPSGEDVAFAAYATDKCLFYMIISAHDDYYYINGNGDPIFCDN